MIARSDTRREAIAALVRQKHEYRRKGSQSRALLNRKRGDPGEEAMAISERIRQIEGLGCEADGDTGNAQGVGEVIEHQRPVPHRLSAPDAIREADAEG